MKPYSLILVLALGCGSKDEAPPPPFTGTLTPDRIMAAKDAVKLNESWSKALPKLEGKLGKVIKIDGKKYKWAAMDGENCTYIVVVPENGKVDVLYNPMTVEPVDKGGAAMNRAECLDILGKTGTPEDPDAPGPPTDEAPVAAADFLKQAVVGRSKWNGKRVKVAGKTPSTMGGDEAIVSEVRCKMKDSSGTPMNTEGIAEGTVEVQRGLRLDGNYVWEAVLLDCTFTPKK